MDMKKVLLPTFLATWLSFGAGFCGQAAAEVVRKAAKGVEITGKAVAKAGEDSGKAVGKERDRQGD